MSSPVEENTVVAALEELGLGDLVTDVEFHLEYRTNVYLYNVVNVLARLVESRRVPGPIAVEWEGIKGSVKIVPVPTTVMRYRLECSCGDFPFDDTYTSEIEALSWARHHIHTYHREIGGKHR